MSSSPCDPDLPSWVGGDAVDAHAHGFQAVDVGQKEFGDHLTESSWPAPEGCMHVDTPLGLAVRHWCAPILDLEPHTSVETYLARRSELGPDEVNDRFVQAAELGSVLVDGGYGGSFVSFRGELEDRKIQAREIVRLETWAEQLVDSSSAESFGDDLHDTLDSVGDEVVGFKTVLAYRSGFDIPAEPPRRDDVVRAVSRWKSRRQDGPARLDDPTILRHLLWAALEAKPSDGRSLRPVQVHVGYGDKDVDLSRTDPLLLTPLVRRIQERNAAPLVLLHGYPFHRHSAYLSAVYPQVYCDVGLSVSHLGASASTVLAESLEVTPFHKMQFSSDACGLSELYFLGSVLFRRALGTVLGRWVDGGDLAIADAERFADLILRGTARRIYHLDDA